MKYLLVNADDHTLDAAPRLALMRGWLRIARVISSLDPEQFQLCFLKWMQAVNSSAKGQLIAIDGKVLRSSYNRDDRQSTIHMVSAFASANGMVLGQVKTDAKSNESVPWALKLTA